MNKIHQYIYAPMKVFYDKGNNYIKNYLNDFFDFYHNVDENENENEKINIIRYYERIDTYSQMISFFKSPTHIIDNIYLGNARNAASYYQLKELNINFIINITQDISLYYPEEFTYYNYNIEDDNNESIKQFFEKSYQNIVNSQNQQNKNILIHCFMGASRSVTLLLYYIIRKNKKRGINVNLDDTIKFIKDKRSVINPTEKYIKDLKSAISHLE